MAEAVIVDVVRTPAGKGKPGGALSWTHPADLLAMVLRGLVERNDLDPALVDDVIAGCVSQVGEQALNIARSATLGAGFPETVPATTVDRQCGSSQQAVHFAAQGVMAGAYDIVIAAGVESMSRVPLGVAAMGTSTTGELMRRRYPELVQQGISAELMAARWQFGREELDAYSAESHRRAAAAAGSGAFARELLPVDAENAHGERITHDTDETIRPATTLEGLAGLKPAFRDEAIAARFPEIGWHITPGNSSPLTDGASAALIMSAERAEQLGLRPRARFAGFAVRGDDPLLMLSAPIPATREVLKKVGLAIGDIDAYEVNEAFAPVPLAWAREVGADPARLNPRGGAIALGHAMGSSGTRLLATLLNYLEDTGGRYGLQTMCEAGGIANATIVERL
ncbi:MAG TPA: acetyl-CoA C-acyltransferase [Amycolatopsis sp.]|nr:acetyl-CoA C-acyltransferase [Amycolatopsis sp.]